MTRIPKHITLDYLNKLDNGLIKDNNGKVIKMCDLTDDVIFKKLFKANELMLKRFLISVLHFDFKPEDIKITFNDKEVLEPKEKTHKFTYDYSITINNNIFLDLEVNNEHFSQKKNKSFLYHARQISSSLNVGENYQKFSDQTFIQLNINAKDESKVGEEIIVPYNTITNSVYMANVITYLRYIAYYKKMYYNKFIYKKEEDYWLAMLSAKSFSELYKILDDFLEEELKDRIIKDVIRLSMKIEFNEQELINLRKQVQWDTEDYINETIKVKSIAIAKNLLNMGLTTQDIMKATGLNDKELENIQNQKTYNK